MAAYPPALQPSSGPVLRVELRLSCKNLRRSDVFSKSDPIVVVNTYDQWQACTEVGSYIHRSSHGTGSSVLCGPSVQILGACR